MSKAIILAAIITVFNFTSSAQSYYESLALRLDSLSNFEAGLNDTVSINVEDVQLDIFVRAIAGSSDLNISVDRDINQKVTNNFHSTQVKNLLLFLARRYDLEIHLYSDIISIEKRRIDTKPSKDSIVQNIIFDPQSNLLIANLNSVPLLKVAKEITEKAGTNLSIDKEIQNLEVSAYYKNIDVESLIMNVAQSYGLEVEQSFSNGLFLKKKASIAKDETPENRNKRKNNKSSSNLEIEIVDTTASIYADKVLLSELINEVAIELKKSVYFKGNVSESVSINLFQVGFHQLIESIIVGKDLTYQYRNGIYVIGRPNELDNQLSTTVYFKYRSVNELSKQLPRKFLSDIEVVELKDLNAIIVSGDEHKAEQFVTLLKEYDHPIPVILIEVLIVDVSKTSNISGGIKAGIGQNDLKTSGTIFPEINIDLSTNSINALINSFNGFGWVKIGNVTPNFYLSIQALEQNGYLKVRSTPKLSTLNGHEATLRIGSTEYYVEEQNNIIGTDNPQLVTTRSYKSVNADMSLSITPMISSNGDITMEITVNQSDFTERISNDAPPGSVNRTFESMVRVKDGEMILLGGLEEISASEAGSGVPILSEIPVLKWFFGTRNKQKTNSKLNIFVRPCIIN